MTPRIAPVAGVRSDCARLRPALLESAEGGGGAALRPRDRAHLDACARCRHEVTDLALMAIAVRRSLAAAREAEPSAEAWPALRARLLRQRGARTLGRIASPVLAALMAAGLAVAMLVPYSLPAARPQIIHEAGIDPAAIRAAGRRDAEDEARQLRVLALAGKEASSTVAPNRARLDLIRYEVDPVSAPRIPTRNPLTASVQ